jgi:hypothetical protein
MICSVSPTAGVDSENADETEEAENMIEMEKGWLLSK